MQLSAISLALTRAGFSAFTPKKLFTSGAQGAWYDPSDYTTLFEDAAGTIPITSPLEKPVGLMLDKSKGLVLGPELVTNGDFSNGTTGWGNQGSVTISVENGELKCVTSSSTYTYAYQDITTVAGKWYKATTTARTLSGVFRLSAWNGAFLSELAFANINTQTNTQVTIYFLAVGTSSRIGVGLYNSSASTCYADNISVRELPGNHATQSTTTSRPTLSARYNVVQKSDQPANSYWTKTNLTVVENAVYETNVTGLHGISILNPGLQAPAGTLTTLSAKVKANGRNYVLLYDNQGRYFDITPGTSGAVLGGSDANVPQASIEPLGDDWFLCRITYPCPSTWHPQIYASDTGARISYAGDVTKGIYITDIDLRVANDGIGLPAYQRVNTATDYDYAGFPPYLKFDGTDDSMVTGSIDFTGTDKMSVFAGVRKLSDAAIGMLAELSAEANSNNGAFAIAAPGWNPVAGQYGSMLRATVNFEVENSPANFAAPISNTITCEFSTTASTDATRTKLRVNGTAQILSFGYGTTVGGNFGNYPLYIGRRGGSSLPFNGRLYSLIVCGKLASAAEITATEAWVNQKTRAFA